ncbi:methyl-accepting chemotaxis protein [Neptuniibacter sp.]|uniref:methyl-accepting chemotaxis protein n=1 Tax=Neptuniibacter sp. TaxID=1962643 RepID=UPI0026070514|nr:HAMP domain-containing methyl-accepting chemotaxis protein [Neptuniibacter sp.]MCP4595186.1 methyl-accepting chemotaxis protein [Neptuniibacter sp.]
MTIKAKLAALIGFILISIATMYGLLHFALESVSTLKSSETEVSNIEASMLMLRRHEKDFLARDDLKYLKKFDATNDKMQQQIYILEEHLDQVGIPHSKTKELHQVIDAYKESFHQLVKMKQTIGLSPKEGLRGSLRSAVHAAETRVKELNNYELLADILQLRRNEKDFLLRKDLKYREKFEKNFQKMISHAEATIVDMVYLEETKALLNTYREGFLTLVGTYEKLGLNSKSGLLGHMRKTIHKSETLLTDQKAEIIEELETEISSILLFASIKALAIAAVVSAIAIFIAQNIVSRLHKLRDVMNNSKQNKDLTLRYKVVANDELSDMGRSYNSMMEEFQALLDDVSKSSLQLSAAAEQVSSISRDTASGLNQQKEEVIQVSSAIQEMEGAMREISHNTDLTSQTATNSQNSASEGQTIINHAIGNITNLAKDATETSQAVTKLEENSNKIGTVLDVIKEIAEQTNLLALNASIEAARAGDHGRGFSVVADEVRGLAGRTQESAAEIEVMINELQQRTGEVSSMMLRSVELSNTSAEEASGTVGALDQIMQDAVQIVDMTTQVASAVEQQTAVASTINQNAEHIQNIVDVANEQVGQNASASEEVARQASHLQTVVGQFKV